MPKTDDETAEIILDHLRVIRTEIGDLRRMGESHSRELTAIRRDILALRRENLATDEVVVDQRSTLDEVLARIARLEQHAGLDQTFQ